MIDNFDKELVRFIDDRIKRIAREETALAVKSAINRIEERAREEVVAISARVARTVSFERHGHDLHITVSFPQNGQNPQG